MALRWPESTIGDKLDASYDQNTTDNLIGDPRIKDTEAYIQSINDAHEGFLQLVEWKSTAVKAELKILHLELVKNSLTAHLNSIIPQIVERSINEHQSNVIKFDWYTSDQLIWKNQDGKNIYRKRYNVKLLVEWGLIFNDPGIDEVREIIAAAHDLWAEFWRDLDDIIDDMNTQLSTAKSNLEENRDTVMNDNLDFILANYDSYKDFIVFTKKHPRRGTTPGKIIENEATKPLIDNLKVAHVDIRKFVDAIQDARKIIEGTQEQKERQEERVEHLQIASLYNQAMNPTSTQFAQASPATQSAPVAQTTPEIVEDTPIQVASTDETTTIPNPAREEMDNLVASVDFSSNKYNDIYTTNPELVEAIQSMLGVEETGSYDADTFEAVKAFQTEKWLAVDGLAGPNTLWIMIDDKIPATITDNPNTQMASLVGWFNPINDTIHLAP